MPTCDMCKYYFVGQYVNQCRHPKNKVIHPLPAGNKTEFWGDPWKLNEKGKCKKFEAKVPDTVEVAEQSPIGPAENEG